ncbi:hypothetical protein PsorP6_001706 [Peronosclerospora sorghi]|uniref:Uncharacterized protein n=1 Tax=Peronosclerospora sorghi TaxID=230839 RepID=A0ACC0WVS9_9STRA|nr:hypothetical protein PsorP6_001706 [Peronosclerospora sorghi]
MVFRHKSHNKSWSDLFRHDRDKIRTTAYVACARVPVESADSESRPCVTHWGDTADESSVDSRDKSGPRSAAVRASGRDAPDTVRLVHEIDIIDTFCNVVCCTVRNNIHVLVQAPNLIPGIRPFAVGETSIDAIPRVTPDLEPIVDALASALVDKETEELENRPILVLPRAIVCPEHQVP